ncbi:MAG: tetratricopeptide repeat protein [Candidatus Aminicenantes bacterium]|nr:tetratricopeptide repeat protein [Candidatus Aminicenantes bacterium]
MRKEHLIHGVWSLLILLLSFCTQSKIEITPQQMAQFNLKIKEADERFNRGSYQELEEASRIYEELTGYPAFQAKTRTKLLKTLLLLVMRERELAVLDDKHLAMASHLIETDPALNNFEKYINMAANIPIDQNMRVLPMRDFISGSEDEQLLSRKIITMSINMEKLKQDWINTKMELQQKALSDIFFAYLFIAQYGYENTSTLDYRNEKTDLSPYQQTFADIPLIQYKLALVPEIDSYALDKIKEKYQEFYEIYYFLGLDALTKGLLLPAEENILKTYQEIPESSSCIMSLTKIYFALEEFEKCLEFNEKALMIAPKYRDALLGKGISLSFLGRQEEAIAVFNTLLKLGYYYIGESYYWTAWNQHLLGQLDEAWQNIETSKNYLIGHYEVHSLAGAIALDKGSLEEAETNFKESLRLNPQDHDSHFYLGKLYGQREDWKASGLNFEKAAEGYSMDEQAIKNKILELEESSLSDERKIKMINKKKSLLVKTRLSKATAFYNGCAGYYNAEMYSKAQEMGEAAASHPSFKEKAEDLLEAIKNLKDHYDKRTVFLN